MKQFVQEVKVESLSIEAKRASTISIKNLTLLYYQFANFEKIGKVKLAKHFKYTLKRLSYTVIKTNQALVVRGIVLNIRKLKSIYINNPNLLSS